MENEWMEQVLRNHLAMLEALETLTGHETLRICAQQTEKLLAQLTAPRQ